MRSTGRRLPARSAWRSLTWMATAAWTWCKGQGEHPTAISERVHSGRGLPPDTAPPSVTMVATADVSGDKIVRARVHDRKSPSLNFEWKRVETEWTLPNGPRAMPMRWYGEYLWRVDWPGRCSGRHAVSSLRHRRCRQSRLREWHQARSSQGRATRFPTSECRAGRCLTRRSTGSHGRCSCR
jgi:hypothetical protein